MNHSSLDDLLASYKEAVNDPEYVEPARGEVTVELPVVEKPVKKRKKKMLPVFIKLFDLEREETRLVNASLVRSIRENEDDEVTYVTFGEDHFYEVKETEKEILALIAEATNKLS